MAIDLGTTDILKAALGTTEFQKVSLGTSLVWEAVTKQTYSFGPPFSGMPPGNDLAMTVGAALTGHSIVSGTMRESASTNTTSGGSSKYSAYVLSDKLGTDLFEVGVGNAVLSTTDRGIGPGVFSDDLTKGVFFIINGNTTSCRIFTWESGVVTQVGTSQAIYSTSSADIMWLRPTVSAGVVTWNCYRNATLLTTAWTDTGHLLDIPGRRAAACFKRVYSGGQFASPGVKSLAAADL